MKIRESIKSISVIVPIYYGEKYIGNLVRQIEKCKAQLDNQDYVELIFINDAPDAPILKKWKSKYIDISVVNSNKNKGIHGARLEGLEISIGEYILFLDQDDKIKPEYLFSQICAIGDNDAVVCKAIKAEKLFYSEYPIFENLLSKERMLMGWNPIISPGQVLLKKKSIPDKWKKNILQYNGADDWFLWLCMLSESCSFILNLEVLYEHVSSGENTSEDIVEMLRSEQEVLSVVLREQIFSAKDFRLLLDSFFSINLGRIHELNLLKRRMNAVEALVKLKENDIKYAEYLKQFKIRNVAIYGCGILGKYLYTELKDDVEVKYFIDRDKNKVHKKIPIYTLNDNLPGVDGVIITLLGEEEEVKEEIQKKMSCSIFMLKKWIMEGKEL